MDNFSLFVDNTDRTCTQFARSLDKSVHHHAVRLLQIFQRKRIKIGQHFIDGKSIFYCKDIVLRA